MEITTFEQLEAVRVKHTLFLINPFSSGNQNKVEIEKLTIHSIHNDNRFTGRAEIKALDIDAVRDHYFTDLLSGCKYVYTIEREAESKLKEIHKGLHADEVNEHHDSCREMRRHFRMNY